VIIKYKIAAVFLFVWNEIGSLLLLEIYSEEKSSFFYKSE